MSDEPEPPENPGESGDSGSSTPGRHHRSDGTPLPPGIERVRVRSRRGRRRRRRNRRLILVAVSVAAGLLIVGLAWLVVTGLLARGQLDQARAEMHTLRTQVSVGDLDAARHTAGQISLHASRAHWLTTGPAWAVTAQVPYLGTPARTTRGLTAAVDRLGSDVLPGVVEASRGLDPSTLRAPDGTVRLGPIAALVPVLDHADRVMDSVTTDIAHLPSDSWLTPVNSARTAALDQLTDLGSSLHSADLAVRIVPPMLGQHGTKRYFVAIQNEAESRGTGGLPGAFAIVSATDGKLKIDKIEPDDTLIGTDATGVDFGAQYRARYGNQPFIEYRDGNLSPHFPYAAQIWLSMWRNYSGQRLDGVVAIDPTTMSYLLAVTGPARMDDGTEVSAANVVALTQSTVYAKFAGSTTSEVTERKEYLVDLARVVSQKILASGPDVKGLIKAAAKATGERRLLVYSTDPATEKLLGQTRLAGEVPITTRPYVGLVVLNSGMNKLDYYLDRSVTWQRVGCGPTRAVTVTIKLTNTAPASGLPKYVTNRSDKHPYPVKPGDNALLIDYLATSGAKLDKVLVDGKPQAAFVGEQRGHPLYDFGLELPRGTTRTVQFYLTEPAAAGTPIVLRQPLVRPLSVTLHDQSCN